MTTAAASVVEFTQLDLQGSHPGTTKKAMQDEGGLREFSPIEGEEHQAKASPDLEMGQPQQQDVPNPAKQGTTRDSAKTSDFPSESAIQVVSSPNGAASPNSVEKELVVEPIGAVLRRAALQFLILLPAFAIFMLAFTEIGFGATIFKLLAGASLSSAFGGAGVLIFFLLYILDVSFWTGPLLAVLRFLLFTLAGLCCVVALILTFQTRPYAPLLGYFVAMVMLCCVVYWRLFRALHPVNYMHALSICLLFAGLVGLLVALAWAGANDFWWGNDTKTEFRARLRVCEDMDACTTYGRVGKACYKGCVEKEAESACAADVSHCLAAFILYAGQLIVSLLTVVIGVAMLLVSRSIIAQHAREGRTGMTPQAKVYAYAVMVLVLMIWIATSIGGASMELSNVVTAFAVTMLATLVVIVGLSLGKTARSRLQGHGTVKKAMAVVRHDWMKGLAMITVAFLIPVILLVSWVNQALRRSPLGRIMKPLTDEERTQSLTTFGKRIYDSLRCWEWSSVLSKALVLGFAYFVLQVGVLRLTSVFLGWLNDYLKTAGLSFWVISVIIFCIGMIMFLIPAVPGVPVYVTTGVTLGAVGEDYLGSFPLAMLWAILVAFVTKLAACAFQQKVIGEQMGNSVWVKATVGINSQAVKAIRLILQRPGLDKDKVMILCGGPDWPTSVLTGILRLPYFGMMVGTLPIVVPVAFTVVAGGCMLKTDQGGIWVSMGSLFLTLSALSLGGCLIGAAIAIENKVSSHREEVAQLPDDADVKKFDDLQAESLARTRAAMAWAGLPLWVRGVLLAAWLLMYISFIAFAQFSDVCFEDVGVTTVYDEEPLNGNVLNVVKGMVGWGALAVHGVSLVLWQIFRMWVKNKAKSLPATALAPADVSAEPTPAPAPGDNLPAPVEPGSGPGFSTESPPPDLGVLTTSNSAEGDAGTPA